MNEKSSYPKSIYCYFKIVKKINIDFRKILKHDMNLEKKEELFYNISGELLRLFPFKVKYDKDRNFLYEFKNDGIIQLENNLNNFNGKFTNILKKHYTTLYQTKKIRNKYEHEPHNINCVCFNNSNTYTEIIFKYKSENLVMNTKKLFELISDINILFYETKKEILKYDKNNKLKNYKFNFLGEII